MLWGNQKFKNGGVTWGRPLAALMALITMLLAFIQVIIVINTPGKVRQEIASKDQQFLRVAIESTCSYIVKNYPASHILLISKPEAASTISTHEGIMAAVNSGFDGKYKSLSKESPRPPLSSILGNDQGNSSDIEFNPNSVELMLRLHPETDVILSLIGLPDNFEKVKFFKMKPKERPKFIVMFPESLFKLKPYLKKGLISEVITYNNRYKPNFKEKLPDDNNEIFKKRFLLINSKNVDQYAAEFPNMFEVVAESNNISNSKQ